MKTTMTSEMRTLLNLMEKGDKEAIVKLNQMIQNGEHNVECYKSTTMPSCVCGLVEAQNLLEANGLISH